MSEFEAYAMRKAKHILEAKNILPLQKRIKSLPYIPSSFLADQGIHIKSLNSKPNQKDLEAIQTLAYELKPWRKGPFYLFDLYIDSEWQSFMKWQLLESKVNLKGKKIADVGCNNGYYMFEMYKHEPESIVGFDPSGIFRTQFDFINHFLQLPISFELLGVEDLPAYCRVKQSGFDVIFCLGVLYHRYDPINTLKFLSNALNPGGELILDTLIYDSEFDVCLCPTQSYAKMSNVYFIPSVSTLRGWCQRAKLYDFEILDIKVTSTNEQRQTQWIDSQSLSSFLNKNQTQSIEGYPPPTRGYFRVKNMREK